MGGIGKTTLARNVYDDDHIMKHFDVRAWVTVSQQYNVDDILERLLSSLPNPKKTHEISRELQLYQSLIGRRYLVVFDDMWSINVWNEIRQNFPVNSDNKGSRIIVTTRLSKLAAELSTGFRLEMKCLDVENSWNLFCEKVFPSKNCHLGLQDVGRKIVQNCGGLPLAIAVIGGLLAKSNQTLKYWEHVAEDFHSCLYSSDDDHCSKILFLSYDHLPIHLKPCLLYLGVFREDEEIRVSQLMSLWIAEGFLKPPVDKTLDANAIAQEYLKDLVERNLIMVSRYSETGKIKKIIIHDLLRELCLREAQKDMFYCVVTVPSIQLPPSTAHQRRIVIGGILDDATLFSDGPYSLGAIRHVRALLFTMVPYISKLIEFPSNLSSLMPLRILFSPDHGVIDVTGNFTANFVNMRYFLNGYGDCQFKHIPYASIGLWRNFQMLDDLSYLKLNRIDIWDLVQLLRVSSGSITVPEHSYGVEDQCSCIALENLQSLGTVVNFKFSEEAMRRIPNVKKLKVFYYMDDAWEGWSHYSAHNLERLEKLESFSCAFEGFTQISKVFLQSVVFPRSLKKLSLEGCELKSEDMSRVVGSLPNLEVLKLSYVDFVGGEWNPVEGEFRCLKFLKMKGGSLKKWNAVGTTHFPRLEILILEGCWELKKIPLDFGQISTLQLIKIRKCFVSTMQSAKNILEERQSFGDDDLVVEVHSWDKCRSIHDVENKNLVATSDSNAYDESDVEEETDENDEEATVENVEGMEPNENSVIGSLGSLAALDDSALVFNTGVVEGHPRNKSRKGRHLNKKKNLMSASQHAQLRQDSNETTSKVIRWDHPLKVEEKNSCSSMEFNPGGSIFLFGQGTYTTNNGARNERTMNTEREIGEEAQGCEQEVNEKESDENDAEEMEQTLPPHEISVLEIFQDLTLETDEEEDEQSVTLT